MKNLLILGAGTAGTADEAVGGDEFSSGGPNCLSCVVSFELPRGSYATVLLRALGQ